MTLNKITAEDYDIFHKLADAYYRDGEDADTSVEEVDGFIRFLFGKAVSGEICGCLVKLDDEYVGFALWALDTEDFSFSEMPGLGTIMEIGISEEHRAAGLGQTLVTHVEKALKDQGAEQAYVCAYGPAEGFWKRCGYIANGKIASNGLPIMAKAL